MTTAQLRWMPAIAIYTDASGLNLTTTSTDITVTTANNAITVSNFNTLSIKEIVTNINKNKVDCEARALIDVTSTVMRSGSLQASAQGTDRTADGGHLLRYLGPIIKNQENTVLQLKAPTSLSSINSWHARIGVGVIRARFSDISFTSYPGVSPNAVYTFSVPEYKNQEWSLRYGGPYKDVFGERPRITPYNANLSTSVLRVSNTPIYWKDKNIVVTINEIEQSTSIIKYVDENNGLIYLSSKLDRGSRVKISYSYREDNYVYDAIDLNVNISHNPINIESYIAFYLKPVSAEGALISGTRNGPSIFHEITNTAIAGQNKVARLIPSTKDTDTPMYEPVIYLGSIQVRQSTRYDDIELIDTRTRGGGIYPDMVGETPAIWRESEFYYDIGNLSGVPIPGNAVIVIKVPDSIKDSDMQKDEIFERSVRSMALGVVPVFDGLE